jgi:hypothetical protein
MKANAEFDSPPQDNDGHTPTQILPATEQTFEREKWEAESLARLREIAIKEREASAKEREVTIKETEARRVFWQTPVWGIIIGAVLAALANAEVAYVNGVNQRELEDRKGETALVLEAIKTNNDPEKAKVNLQFLVEAGLITEGNRRAQLVTFLKLPARQPVSIITQDIVKALSAALKAMVMVALPITSLFIVYTGFLYVSARGNPNQIATAKRSFFYVMTGAVLILGAWLLAQLVGDTAQLILPR